MIHAENPILSLRGCRVGGKNGPEHISVASGLMHQQGSKMVECTISRRRFTRIKRWCMNVEDFSQALLSYRMRIFA